MCIKRLLETVTAESIYHYAFNGNCEGRRKGKEKEKRVLVFLSISPFFSFLLLLVGARAEGAIVVQAICPLSAPALRREEEGEEEEKI